MWIKASGLCRLRNLLLKMEEFTSNSRFKAHKSKFNNNLIINIFLISSSKCYSILRSMWRTSCNYLKLYQECLNNSHLLSRTLMGPILFNLRTLGKLVYLLTANNNNFNKETNKISTRTKISPQPLSERAKASKNWSKRAHKSKKMMKRSSLNNKLQFQICLRSQGVAPLK